MSCMLCYFKSMRPRIPSSTSALPLNLDLGSEPEVKGQLPVNYKASTILATAVGN